ncbi:proton-dependent oligopeptide transporter, POT family [Trypanosoma grayi]|uniref:proton-dependent oligopeptide transporter, POT family n=1 Tax=Trypanosoma grayi TaxID=71804 RepID=UPI0004F44A25|nr:proton-dependent oligopeptide transporter, POT family [Trypanosoma grayi]KEG15276.1 proton-dependent oligopeptide transporter, POT family [Trypanosoma grayi]
MATLKLFGFPFQVWIVMTVEFAERLGYYGTTFMLMTYCTVMLRWSPTAGNALINSLYAIAPASACVSSGLADGRWGRPFALVVFMSALVAGLSLVALSSAPFMYGDFPLEPSVSSVIMFAVGMSLFAVGYGGMKVCTNPLMADIVSAVYQDSETGCHVVLSQLFRWIYCVTNSGALLGIVGPPLLRGVEKRHTIMGSVTYTTGYYIGFSVSAGSCAVGLLLFVITYRWFQRNERVPSFVLGRILLHAIRIRWLFFIGSICDDEFLRAHRWDLIDFAGYPAAAMGSADEKRFYEVAAKNPELAENLWKATEKDERAQQQNGFPMNALDDTNNETGEDVTISEHIAAEKMSALDPVWIADAKKVSDVCRVLVIMPVYWLVTNQFSTNMILQAAAVDLPTNIPPEVFNNINVVALLISLVFFDRLLFPFMFGDRRPPVRGRVLAGMCIMIVSMVWCGFVQLGVESRGIYDSENDYNLYPGEKMLPAGWLVPPYAMQGVASALVDTTIMEVTYIVAPVSMKGAVMALYLMASSISGFLGLALSPVMLPTNIMIIMFALAGALFFVGGLFFLLNPPSEDMATPSSCNDVDTVVESDTLTKHESDHLLHRESTHTQDSFQYGCAPCTLVEGEVREAKDTDAHALSGK